MGPHIVSCDFSDDYTANTGVSISADIRGKLHSSYVAIKPLGYQLDEFLVYKLDEGVVKGENRVRVNDFAKFNDEVTIDRALIMGIQPVTLTKVIIAFPREVYELLKKHTGAELLKVLTKSMDLDIIRQGDTLISQGRVLLCEPVPQGKLTEDTLVTLIKDTTPSIDRTQQLRIPSLDISSYLGGSTVEDIEFDIVPLELKVAYTIPLSEPTDDDMNLAYVKTTDLTKIGCFSGDYIDLMVDGIPRLMKVLSFAEPNSYQNGQMHISPFSWINLGSPTKLTARRTPRTLSKIPIASSITLARVASPITLNKTYQQSFFSALKLFFESRARVVSMGDLIPVTIDTLLAKTLPLDYEGPIPIGKPNAMVWFRITSINDTEEKDGLQYIVDPSHSKMSQSGILDILPPSLQDTNWIKYADLLESFNFIADDSLFPYAKELSKLVKSSLGTPQLRTTVLLSSMNRNIGKSFIVENVAQQLGLHFTMIDGYEVLNPTSDLKTIGYIRGKLDRLVEECSHLVVLIKHLEALTVKEEQNTKPGLLNAKVVELIEEYTNKGAIFIATTNDSDKLPEEVRSKFRFEIEVPVPSENERSRIFDHLLKQHDGFKLRSDVSLSSLALQSAGLTPRDLISIVTNAKSLALERLEELAERLETSLSFITLNNPIQLTPQDFEKSINDARNKFSDSIGAPRIPNVTWDDIGGLDVVKDEILDTIDLPLKHPELFSNGVKKRSGILFYGPPGTGKTLLAKAIATNFSLNFFSVKGPELLNMYIGESEANVRKVFQRARDAKPCVVFFDELDSVAPKRGNQGDSGGVMDRIVSQLLAELDGMSGGDAGDGVFVVGATNRPDLLDEALLRPGRFDKMLYLGISDTHEKQQKILEALTRKFKLDPSVNLEKVANSCPYNFTGADFYALCSDAMLNAMTRVAGEVDGKIAEYNKDREDPVSLRWWFDNVATSDDIAVLVKEEDFDKARRELSPSVSAEELEHYLRVRENFEGGKTKK
jgi:peroxin-6